MYINQVKIQNYRNFGNSNFILALNPFTLIIGENNVGKTNLLNALGLIFNQDISIFRKRILEIDDINYDTIQAFKKMVCDPNIAPENIRFPEVKIEVLLTGFNEDQEAIVGNWFINKELTEAKITYLFAPKSTFNKVSWANEQRKNLKNEGKENNLQNMRLVDFPIGEYRYSIFGGDDITNECETHYLRMLKMEFLDALRDAQQELVASGGYRLLYRILSSTEYGYGDIKSVLSQLETAVKRNKDLNIIKEQVESLLDRVSLQTTPTDNKIDFNFSTPESREMLKKISLIYGSEPINVDRNGLGRNNLLYISLVLSHLSAKDNRGDDTFFRIIGIEEPEAHLHPHLEDHLAENIESVLADNKDKMQLLLTSHSTHIAAKLTLNNTVILFEDKERGQIRSHYILSGLDVNKEKSSIHYLSKYLDATKSRMFFARKLILVEGISEHILVPIFFKLHFGSSAEKYGCEIINVRGVAFSHFLKIIRSGYFIKCLVLTDKDSEKRTEERANNLKQAFDEESLIRVQISHNSTFEKDLIGHNKTGRGKEILLKALIDTKPTKGVEFVGQLGQEPINVDNFFREIENYKSEFAFNLQKQLTVSNTNFTIPKYIEDGLDFIGN